MNVPVMNDQRDLEGLSALVTGATSGIGLTDREIGDRLFLSPRTVSSHLYRSYPKLGVASRHQLHDVIARAGS